MLLSIFAEFTRSDMTGPPPAHWHILLTGQMAHCLIGVLLGLYRVPRRPLGVILGLLLLKEVLGDIPDSGGDMRVIADSVADIGFVVLGFWLIWSKRRAEGWSNRLPGKGEAEAKYKCQ